MDPWNFDWKNFAARMIPLNILFVRRCWNCLRRNKSCGWNNGSIIPKVFV